jgi:hypothetical protein
MFTIVYFLLAGITISVGVIALFIHSIVIEILMLKNSCENASRDIIAIHGDMYDTDDDTDHDTNLFLIGYNLRPCFTPVISVNSVSLTEIAYCSIILLANLKHLNVKSLNIGDIVDKLFIFDNISVGSVLDSIGISKYDMTRGFEISNLTESRQLVIDKFIHKNSEMCFVLPCDARYINDHWSSEEKKYFKNGLTKLDSTLNKMGIDLLMPDELHAFVFSVDNE